MTEIPVMTPLDAERFHHACKMIEVDGEQAYWSVRAKYGENVANAVLIFWLRTRLNDKPEQYPLPEDLTDKVNKVLRELHLLAPETR